MIAILMFAGTVGKSAQFPLHVWLPDAMEGPTPVSAMIHAATMVSAGVYLAAAHLPVASWLASRGTDHRYDDVMAFIGAFTALFAATIAVAQCDIKRVLAYSTISQLGYMVQPSAWGLRGGGLPPADPCFLQGPAVPGLRLGHPRHGTWRAADRRDVDPQDMRNMGGLRQKMPFTFWTFMIGGLALSGFPLFTAGFWSKDEILAGAFNSGHLGVFVTLALAALLTAFYTAPDHFDLPGRAAYQQQNMPGNQMGHDVPTAGPVGFCGCDGLARHSREFPFYWV